MIELKRFTLRNSVRICSFSGPYFLAFGLNTERYRASLPIQSESVKIRTRKTPNKNTFTQCYFYYLYLSSDWWWMKTKLKPQVMQILREKTLFWKIYSGVSFHWESNLVHLYVKTIFSQMHREVKVNQYKLLSRDHSFRIYAKFS